ncbi:hypothetical protein ACH50O_13825 [Methylomonas sp. 2BW1-5-20]|uniref:hypothetical protein n=1 Tax=Methylomonas sp. 2BW1-5-20 TaxID=3376686 RepID=UPI00404D1FE5
MFKAFGASRGWIRFSPRMHELTTRLKCLNYPELYQDEARIHTALFRAFFDDDEKINQFLTELTSRPVEEQSEFLNQTLQESTEFGQWMDEKFVHLDALDWSTAGRAKAQLEFEKLPIEEQQKAIRTFQLTLSFGLASFHNFVALMVHGRKLTQLVNEAMTGNDDSFYLAAHIDRNILEQIPYFKNRYLRAQREGEENFLRPLNYRLQSPQFKGKIRHRLLYMLFTILESMRWLDDLKHREILDICDQLGLERYENRIETEKALGDRLRDYRDFQIMNRMSTL